MIQHLQNEKSPHKKIIVFITQKPIRSLFHYWALCQPKIRKPKELKFADFFYDKFPIFF
jgi:hypothetical protein